MKAPHTGVVVALHKGPAMPKGLPCCDAIVCAVYPTNMHMVLFCCVLLSYCDFCANIFEGNFTGMPVKSALTH